MIHKRSFLSEVDLEEQTFVLKHLGGAAGKGMVGIWAPETRVQIKGVWKLKAMTGSALQVKLVRRLLPSDVQHIVEQLGNFQLLRWHSPLPANRKALPAEIQHKQSD